MDTKNILLVGVGGQGTILVGKILSQALIDARFDVKMSEIHGMSQRGGSVSTEVIFGDKVFSPIMRPGSADFLIAFEIMEALRWLVYLNPMGKVVVNDYKIPSAPILMGKADYPENALQTLQEKADVTVINGAEIAKQLGNPRTMNIVLLGALAKRLALKEIDWESAIRKEVKDSFIDINLKAFQVGFQI